MVAMRVLDDSKLDKQPRDGKKSYVQRGHTLVHRKSSEKQDAVNRARCAAPSFQYESGGTPGLAASRASRRGGMGCAVARPWKMNRAPRHPTVKGVLAQVGWDKTCAMALDQSLASSAGPKVWVWVLDEDAFSRGEGHFRRNSRRK